MAEPIQEVVVLVFNGIERLDIEGPLGVLGWAARIANQNLKIRFVSKDGRSVEDHLLGRSISVDGAVTDVASTDLLLVPGGDLSRFGNDSDLVAAVKRIGATSRYLVSVCTGAFLVAQAGLADGKTMATHWKTHSQFRSRFPKINLASDRRYVQDQNLWSSAGISAGIDMTLRFVISQWGESTAKEVQDFLEYFPEPPFPRS